jgi:hypothetical protein
MQQNLMEKSSFLFSTDPDERQWKVLPRDIEQHPEDNSHLRHTLHPDERIEYQEQL